MNQDDKLMSPSWISVPVRNTDGMVTGYRPLRYDQFVLKLFKVMDFEKMVVHATLGIANEAGEIAGAVKKMQAYGQDINLRNLKEELGDMRFFLQAIQNLYGITDAEVLQQNAEKLSERYLNLEYSDAQAALRRDKKSTGETE